MWRFQLLKTVGWRVVAVTGALYAALYVYERMTWTARAQQRVFKQQYVAHASKKLRLIVDLTSANCSHQVQQSVIVLLTCYRINYVMLTSENSYIVP